MNSRCSAVLAARTGDESRRLYHRRHLRRAIRTSDGDDLGGKVRRGRAAAIPAV
jgi:hypothetical protein